MVNELLSVIEVIEAAPERKELMEHSYRYRLTHLYFSIPGFDQGGMNS
jgi:hypothetical protein